MLLLEEGEQVSVDLVLVGGAEAVACAGVDLELGGGDQFGGGDRGGGDGDHLVGVAVQDEGGDVELFEVFGEVGLGEGLDAVEDGLETGGHSLALEAVAQALGDFAAGLVGTVKGRADVLEELGSVGEEGGADLVEDLDGQAAGVGLGLEH